VRHRIICRGRRVCDDADDSDDDDNNDDDDNDDNTKTTKMTRTKPKSWHGINYNSTNQYAWEGDAVLTTPIPRRRVQRARLAGGGGGERWGGRVGKGGTTDVTLCIVADTDVIKHDYERWNIDTVGNLCPR